MSYGRRPYLILEGQDNVRIVLDGKMVSIPSDAIAQFIVSMAWRGQEEVNRWMERGKQLRPDLDNFELTYKRKR
jgi:hypothetical protein